MVIYGVALLAGCMLVGLWAGDVLGILLGVDSNVGGVGIAMLMLIFLGGYLMDKNKMPASTEDGIKFWNGMYIPIVVAMAASQDVAAAFDGGMIALLAALLAVIVSFALIPFLNRLGRATPAEKKAGETKDIVPVSPKGAKKALSASSSPHSHASARARHAR
ncbi:malonate transporter subunit MadL [Vreelandella populi]|uniref:Malonate transporter subunit MadL n=1 Tax=Vreelandella populi TaxID=2498858 RepID=A0A3S0YDL6_9GAMM|nr:malonate transporter subunit MadL [Halomonas populi]RUR35395.1 malonate transporter subunit MadL [Halomonas populi]RUR47585.1 malonate transporter subunit MadL [Halomonas populi]RUR54551.1 malonate transporter subunit MadL [Halomonas populi]